MSLSLQAAAGGGQDCAASGAGAGGGSAVVVAGACLAPRIAHFALRSPGRSVLTIWCSRHPCLVILCRRWAEPCDSAALTENAAVVTAVCCGTAPGLTPVECDPWPASCGPGCMEVWRPFWQQCYTELSAALQTNEPRLRALTSPAAAILFPCTARQSITLGLDARLEAARLRRTHAPLSLRPALRRRQEVRPASGARPGCCGGGGRRRRCWQCDEQRGCGERGQFRAALR